MASERPVPGIPAMEITLVDHAPLCGRCGAETLLGAQVPYTVAGLNGAPVRCLRDVVLCASCDQADPAAGALITFFTVHGAVAEEQADEFAALVTIWAEHVRAPEVELAALECDIEAWHRGDLDADEPALPGPYSEDDDRLDWPDDRAAEDDWP
jgi:Family of unknown function (DUF6300)